MARTKRSKVKSSLVDQLEDRGVISEFFYDLIDDYMQFWDIKNLLIRDIKERGVYVEWKNGESQSGVKKNDSLFELRQMNGQMLKVLQQLSLSTEEDVIDDDEEF